MSNTIEPHQPFCVVCQRELVVMKVGVNCVDIIKREGKDVPYRLWSCDVFSCPSCGIKVAYGFGNNPRKRFPSNEDLEKLDHYIVCKYKA